MYAHLILFSIAGAGYLISLIPPDNSSGIEDAQRPVVSTVLSERALKGKPLFANKCQSCHSIFKELTGPALAGFEDRGPWKDRNKLYEWIRNPSMFMANNSYVQELKKKYGSMMSAFPDITNTEIDFIADYVMEAGKQ